MAAIAIAILGAALPSDSSAQTRRARLSKDLSQRLDAGDIRATSVILTGSQQRIDRIAQRNGLRVTKRLSTGAVVTVPAGALAGLAADRDVDLIASNAVVEAHDDVTNATIGADLVQAGGWVQGAPGLTGKGSAWR
jgi:hypothetical protein